MTIETVIAISSLVTISTIRLALSIKQLEQSRCTTINDLCFKYHHKVPQNEDDANDIEMQELDSNSWSTNI